MVQNAADWGLAAGPRDPVLADAFAAARDRQAPLRFQSR